MFTAAACSSILAEIRARKPLVHNITNYVVMNNTANALLALGASPAMVHANEEVEEFVAIASALVINIGTLSPAWITAMHTAARTAATRGIPFRRYERRTLEAVIERYPGAVIATGGSLVSEPGTFDLLLAACFTVWLKAAPEEHMGRVLAQGDLRPMADNSEAMDDLRRILAGREALYTKADAAVDTAGRSVTESLSALRAAVAP